MDSLLFTPFRIGRMTLANRIVLPAMVTRLCGEDGFVNDAIRDRYLRFAEGGAGLIVLEAMAVHRAKSGPLLRICDDAYVPGLADLCHRMHAISDSRVAPQIIHFLKISRSGYRQRVGDLTIDEIYQIREGYAAAARRAREAGFDAVELHMAHAYTLSSFLSTRNQRPDEYGRTLENRLRLPCEVLLAVRAAVGGDFPVGIRFLADECIKNGATVEETKYVALRFAQLGADWLSLSNGGKFEDAVAKPGEPLYPYTGYSGDRCMPGRNYTDAANLASAAEIRLFVRSHGLETPVVATGKIRARPHAESILRDGGADLIGMARPLLADPELPRKWRDGREDAVIHCVYANICKSLDENFKEVRCYLWPAGARQAPRSSSRTAPAWPGGGAALAAAIERGRAELTWAAASGPEGIYGYDVERSQDGGEFTKIGAAKTPRFHDERAIGGIRYRYRVRAYDFAGNRCEYSNIETVYFPVAPAHAGGNGN
ncbi:MAG: NADH:flavin oxidoreductase [Planctomycetes bacterium]|nr:NADH:flavin oxidoreductase [Planctomycetota bacterium]